MMRLVYGRVAALTAGFILVAATAGCDSKAVLQEARSVIDAYYEAIEEQDFNAALQLYGERFFEQVERPAWAQALRAQQATLGAYQSHELSNKRVHEPLSSRYGGPLVILVYRVQYAEAEAIEKFTLMRKPDGDRLQIVGHNIDSKALEHPLYDQ